MAGGRKNSGRVPHVPSAFGEDAFGRRAERAARFFGTPQYILGQTIVVAVWITLNAVAVSLRWDPYPFILLNLAFSTQAAYAAPLILLAQTRQADRDKAHAEADALHREELAQASCERQEVSAQQSARLLELLEQNTKLTRLTQELSQRIKELTDEMHSKIMLSA
jgi:uncharacterized membrane protein